MWRIFYEGTTCHRSLKLIPKIPQLLKKIKHKVCLLFICCLPKCPGFELQMTPPPPKTVHRPPTLKHQQKTISIMISSFLNFHTLFFWYIFIIIQFSTYFRLFLQFDFLFSTHFWLFLRFDYKFSTYFRLILRFPCF